MVSCLRSKLEANHGIRITEAVFTSSHLVALYKDDLEDTASYLGIKYVTPKSNHRPIVWETVSAYAGYGLGLCKHWQDDKLCMEENRKMKEMTILLVHYTSNALTVAMPILKWAVGSWEPEHRHIENFTLGHDAMADFHTPAEYWAAVRETLLYSATLLPRAPKPKRIIVSGDMVEGEFMEFLKKTMEDHIGTVPPIFSDLAVVAAAQSAAEIMRRGPASWSIGEPGK